jgi:TatD DNase family protein
LNLIDTHAHLTDDKFENSLDLIIIRANQAGIKSIITCGYDLESSIKGIKLSEKYSCVYASIGVHPHDSKNYDKNCEGKFTEIACNDKVIAIGEIGLDFHYNFSPKEKQYFAFEAQLELASKLKLPIIIHSRESNKEVLEVLYSWKDKLSGGVLHCFSGNIDDLKKVLDLGFYIGLDGPITFKKNQELTEVVEYCPLNRILLETDCPYLAPVPHRGKLNEPSYLRYIADKIAEIKGLSNTEICTSTTQNALNLFNKGLHIP